MCRSVWATVCAGIKGMCNEYAQGLGVCLSLEGEGCLPWVGAEDMGNMLE